MLGKRFVVVLVLLSALIGGAVWYFAMRPGVADKGQTPPAADVARGDKLPALTLPDEGGRAVVLPPTNGRVTVLNFWASWCPPCRGEMPDLAQFAQQHRGQVNFYAINLQESPAKVQAYLAREQLSLPVLFDQNGAAAQALRITAIPTTVLVDKNGVIRFRKTGPVTQEELRAAVTVAAGEKR